MTTCCYFLFCQSVGLLFYSPSISLQLIFGVSCTLTQRQTCPGRRTSSALPPGSSGACPASLGLNPFGYGSPFPVVRRHVRGNFAMPGTFWFVENFNLPPVKIKLN